MYSDTKQGASDHEFMVRLGEEMRRRDEQVREAMLAGSAMRDGWGSLQSKRDARVRLLAAAANVVEQRRRIGDPCLTWNDLHDSLEDRVAAGLVLVPGTPTVVALNEMVLGCVRDVWRLEQKRQEAEAWEGRMDEMVADGDDYDLGRAA